MPWEILGGLPGTGDAPQQYGERGESTHSEGLVVRFTSLGGQPWVANFQPGHTTFSSVLALGEEDLVLVVAGGRAYVLEVATQRLRDIFGGLIEAALPIRSGGPVVVSERGRLTYWTEAGARWTSRALAHEGVIPVRCDDSRVYATTPDDTAHDPLIAIDLATGRVVR